MAVSHVTFGIRVTEDRKDENFWRILCYILHLSTVQNYASTSPFLILCWCMVWHQQVHSMQLLKKVSAYMCGVCCRSAAAKDSQLSMAFF